MKKINKQLLVTIIVVLTLLITTLGLSVAFFSYIKEGTTENIIELGSITFRYTENDNLGNGITIEEAFPISDDEGKIQNEEGKVFDFKIESTLSRSDLEYEIVAETTSESTLPLDAIKFYLTDVTNGIETEITSTINEEGKVKTLDEYSDTEITNAEGKTIYKETILKNTKNYLKEFRARMWLKDGLDWTDEKYIGKTTAIKINVYANSNRDMASTNNTTPVDTSIERITANNKYLFNKVENEEYQYTLNVPNETETLDINVIPSNTEATVEVMQLNRSINLQYGDNYFRTLVTSSNGNKKQEYILKVHRELDKDNTLFSLGVKEYSLNPIFDPEITEYNLTLEESSIEITATSTSSLASISGTGIKELEWGNNELEIIVTAQSGELKTYKIIINNERPSAPIITGGSEEWVSTPPTIKVSKAGSAISGVKHYEYYKSTEKVTPTDSTTATGITTGDLTITDEGTTYIWYRTVSNNGFKSEWSSNQVVKLDTGVPSAPTITGGSGSWSSTAKTISVSKEASATSEISYYQYCESTSTSSCNGTWTNLAAGTKSVSISTNGTRYIYFRGVSGVGTAGTASSYQTTIIDTSNPTVTVSVSGKTATFTIKDNLGTVGYGVNQSTTTQPSYVSYATTSGTRTWTASAAGTYQVWVKDNAGRTGRAQFTIASSAFCAYSTGKTWTYNYTGGAQSFTVPCSGTYKLEVWGAQGGSGQGAGGKGGYSYGNVSLTNNKVLYIVVGGQGTSNISSGNATGGYNGGGSGYANDAGYEGAYAGGGGGATHIGATNTILSSTTSTNLYIVAGGGGGGAKGQLVNACAGGAGGGTATAGTSANYGDGNKGYAGAIGGGSYGKGQSSTSSSTTGLVSAGGGGGGGYSGGGSGYATGYAAGGSGAGGTGYIGGVTGGSMQNGQRSGNGYARITLVTISQ